MHNFLLENIELNVGDPSAFLGGACPLELTVDRDAP